MNDAPVALDEHPWDGSAESHRPSSASAEVAANEEAWRTTQEELETQLIAAPASTWEKAADKVPYLFSVLAATQGMQDPRPKTLVVCDCRRAGPVISRASTRTPASRQQAFPGW
jgi:hypothetical protein